MFCLFIYLFYVNIPRVHIDVDVDDGVPWLVDPVGEEVSYVHIRELSESAIFLHGPCKTTEHIVRIRVPVFPLVNMKISWVSQ